MRLYKGKSGVDNEKVNARAHVARLIKSGKLKRPETCTFCNTKGKIHAHHCDHKKIMDIMWMCTKCHGYFHKRVNDWLRYFEHNNDLLSIFKKA